MSIRETSRASLRNVIDSGVLGIMQKLVYEALHIYGPCTANELYTQLTKRKRINQANITTRLGELRAMGCVVEKAKRECSITGKLVLVWECTGASPVKVIRQKSKSCQIAELKSLLRTAELFADFYAEFPDDEEDEELVEDWQKAVKEVLK